MNLFGTKFTIAIAIGCAVVVGWVAPIAIAQATIDETVIVQLSAIPMVLFWFGWMVTLYIGEGTSKVSRSLATLGLALLIEHVLIAFHLTHDWSHQSAFEHTEAVSGYGFGIWVNYAFVLLWTIDVLWQWLHVASYLRRPNWLAIGVQVFYAFIMFNATVVYGHDVVRWVATMLFLLLAFLLYQRVCEPSVAEEPL